MIQISGPGASRSGAANDYEVLSLASLKVLLSIASGTGDDVLLQSILDAAHQAAFRATGGRIFKLNATAYVHLYDGRGNTTLRVRQLPIVTLTGLEEGYLADSAGTFVSLRTFGTTEYYVDKDNGIIRAINGAYFNEGQNNLRVTMTCGYSTAPGDLVRAIADLCGLMRKRIVEKSWDVTSMSKNDELKTFISAEMPKSVENVFRRYQRTEAIIG